MEFLFTPFTRVPSPGRDSFFPTINDVECKCSCQRSLNWCIMTHIWLSIATSNSSDVHSARTLSIPPHLHRASAHMSFVIWNASHGAAIAVCFLKRAVTIIRNRMNRSWSVVALGKEELSRRWEGTMGCRFMMRWRVKCWNIVDNVDKISSLMLSLRLQLHVPRSSSSSPFALSSRWNVFCARNKQLADDFSSH